VFVQQIHESEQISGGQQNAIRIDVVKSAIGAVMMLHEFVTLNRSEIIARSRAKARGRFPRLVNTTEADDGVPSFLTQLVHELRPGLSSRCEITILSTVYSRDLLSRGMSITQLVHDYSDIGQTIAELALDEGVAISVEDVEVLDRCIDDAVAGAVTEHRRRRQGPNVTAAALGRDDRILSISSELREVINTARVALRAVKSGRVGLAGSTGGVIDRSLLDANDLNDRLLELLDVQRYSRSY
jgi:hypothetical protein